MALREGISWRWRFGIFVNVVLICLLALVLAVGLIVLVKRLSYGHDLRFDLTRDHRYTLAPVTEELLQGLTDPVEVTFVYGIDRNMMARAPDPGGLGPNDRILRDYYAPVLGTIVRRTQELLREWELTSSEIVLHIADNGMFPGETARLATLLGRRGEDLLNKVILSRGNRQREVPLDRVVDVDWGYFPPYQTPRIPGIRGGWRVQDELAGALESLLRGRRTVVGVIQGLDSRFEPGTAAFMPVEQVLRAQDYELRPVPCGGGIPDGLDALLVLAPRAAPNVEQERVLREYEERGGRILLLSHPDSPVTWDRLLEPYDVRLTDHEVEDSVISPQAMRSPPAYDIESILLLTGRTPFDAPLKGKVPIYLGLSRPIVVGDLNVPGAERVTFAQGTAEAMLMPIAFDTQTGETTRVPTRLARAPKAPSLGVMLRRKVGDETGEARLVVFGSAGLLREEALEQVRGNRELLLNALAWLTDRPRGVGIPGYDEERVLLEPVEKVFAPITWLAVFGLPLLMLLGAIVTVVMRRG